MATPTKSEITELRDAYQTVYDALDRAYWAASTIEAKDRIYGVSDLIFDILTRLNRADILSRTKEYAALKEQVETINAKLDTLKQEIDRIIHAIKIATEVTKAIEKVVELAGKVLV